MASPSRNLGLFVVAAVLGGGVYVANKAGLPYIPPVIFGSLRFLIASTVLLPIVAARSEPLRPRTRADVLTILASGGLIVAAANVFLFVGQQYTTSATAAVLISLSPILTVALAAVLVPDDVLTRAQTVGVLLGLVGVAIVARPTAGVPSSTEGTALLVLAAVSLAVGGVALRRLRGTLSSLAVAAWATLLGGALMLAFGLSIGESFAAVSWTRVATLAVVYNGLIATPLGYVAYFVLLDRVGPIRVNLLTYVSPVVTAVAGWIVLGERVSPSIVAGFAVIATGFVLLEHPRLRRESSRVRGFFRDW